MSAVLLGTGTFCLGYAVALLVCRWERRAEERERARLDALWARFR